MKAEIGAEVRYMGQRVKVLAVRGWGQSLVVDVMYMTGSYIGREATVDERDLEPIDAYARPTFKRQQSGAAT